MKITKKSLCALPSCYAAAFLRQDGAMKYLLATDGPGACVAIDTATGEAEAVWNAPGGTMSLVPLPGEDQGFLAVQNFMPGFQAEGARIVHACKEDGVWRVRPWRNIPYIHRFDILERGGVQYLLFCTLCEEKNSLEDWSSPGKLFVAPLPESFDGPVSLQQIASGMTCNHGYCRVEHEGWTSALTACKQGVFEVLPPKAPEEEWVVRCVLNHAVSDIALCDIDGDGIPELAAIEPFHGDSFVVYRQTESGYLPLYRYPRQIGFCHVVWGGVLRGEPVFLGGCRSGEKELFLLRWKNGSISEELLETGMGPSNVAVFHTPNKDFILTANREGGEGAVFEIENC